jgi:hypothetical protein
VSDVIKIMKYSLIKFRILLSIIRNNLQYVGTTVHWTGGWVGPRAVLDKVVKRKIPSYHGSYWPSITHINRNIISTENETKSCQCFLNWKAIYTYDFPVSLYLFLILLPFGSLYEFEEASWCSESVFCRYLLSNSVSMQLEVIHSVTIRQFY